MTTTTPPKSEPDLNFIAPFPVAECCELLQGIQSQNFWARDRRRVSITAGTPGVYEFQVYKRVGKNFPSQIVGTLRDLGNGTTSVEGRSVIPQWIWIFLIVHGGIFLSIFGYATTQTPVGLCGIIGYFAFWGVMFMMGRSQSRGLMQLIQTTLTSKA